MPKLDEFALISRFFKPLTGNDPRALGLTDDAAVLSFEQGVRLAVTVDTVIEGVHFLPADPPDTVGAKALGVNLSDLAAMGARPTAYVMSLSLPMDWQAHQLKAWMGAFCRGLDATQIEHGIHLLGGDTVRGPGPLAITITAFGTLKTSSYLRRSGAQPGDIVFVTGTIGDAALGLEILKGRITEISETHASMLIERYRRPQPHVALGQRLCGMARAAADVSDGLIADLAHICEASNVYATIAVDRLPLSSSARAVLAENANLLPLIVTGGDDYELVFTAGADRMDSINHLAKTVDVSVTAIGKIESDLRTPADHCRTNQPRVRLVDSNGVAVETGSGGYRHI